MWQSQLSVVGKVFPIILPDGLTDVSLNIPLTELAENMLVCSMQRVQEVRPYKCCACMRYIHAADDLGIGQIIVFVRLGDQDICTMRFIFCDAWCQCAEF